MLNNACALDEKKNNVCAYHFNKKKMYSLCSIINAALHEENMFIWMMEGYVFFRVSSHFSLKVYPQLFFTSDKKDIGGREESSLGAFNFHRSPSSCTRYSHMLQRRHKWLQLDCPGGGGTLEWAFEKQRHRTGSLEPESRKLSRRATLHPDQIRLCLQARTSAKHMVKFRELSSLM